MPNCIALQSLLSFYCTALWLWRHADAHQHTSKYMDVLKAGVVDEELSNLRGEFVFSSLFGVLYHDFCSGKRDIHGSG